MTRPLIINTIHGIGFIIAGVVPLAAVLAWLT